MKIIPYLNDDDRLLPQLLPEDVLVAHRGSLVDAASSSSAILRIPPARRPPPVLSAAAAVFPPLDRVPLVLETQVHGSPSVNVNLIQGRDEFNFTRIQLCTCLGLL